MPRSRILVFFLAVLAAALSHIPPSFVLAQQLSEGALVVQEKGFSVDWTALRVTGRSEAGQDTRQAVLAARRTLLEAVRALPIGSGLPAGGRASSSRSVLERTRALVQDSALAVQPGAPVLASLRLSGELLDLLLPVASRFQTGIPPRLSDAPPPALPDLESVRKGVLALRRRQPVSDKPLEGFRHAPAPLPAAQPLAPDTEHTGIVLDARGQGVTPALLPVVHDEAGVGLYGAFLVTRAAVVRTGLVVYAQNSAQSAVTERVGANPLVLRAASCSEVPGPDLCLGAEQSAQARAVLMNKTLAQRCPVAILTDFPAVPVRSSQE